MLPNKTAGRLETRTWERGVLTTYDYDDGGRLETVTYSNETNGHTTPDLVNTYDALGRLRTVTRGGVLHAEYTYRTSDLQRLAEIQQIDTLNQAVTYTYEDGTNGPLAGRPNGYTSTHASATWSYDQAGRLETVSNGTDTFTYGYRYTLNGGLHEGVITPGQGTESAMPFTLHGPQVDTTLAYETTRQALAFRRNDLTGGTLSKFAYGLNDLGQRVALTPTGSAFATTTPFSWGYNGRGELTAATRSGNTPFERAYSYDGIGNRLFSETSGSQISDPAGPNTTAYTPNALNQYSSITLNSSPSTLNPSHDDDGNMTSGPVPGANGLLPGVPVPANATLTWDAENRLVKAVVNGTTVHYDYDHQSRLISRGVGVTPSTFTRYLYDGWNRIAEYESNGSGHTLKSTYLWGMDLSGTMQGAGGVGGLLSMTLNSQPSPLNYYPTYDGNGNVSEYVDDNGVKAAHFEYDPFGNLTVDSENNAANFPYRFSSKPQDATTGLFYYGYRWYDSVTGHWLSRDPIEERGGVNLFGFSRNDAVNSVDAFGMFILSRPQQKEGFNEAIEKAFEKLTKAELEWRPLRNDPYDRILCATKNGDTDLWALLRSAIGSKEKVIRMVYRQDTATGGADTITIDPWWDWEVYVLPHRHPVLDTYNSAPAVVLEKISFEAMLWHEFAGHTMAAEEDRHHVTALWNRWDEGKKEKEKRDPAWGTKFDYAIQKENEARKILKESSRAPWYEGYPPREEEKK